LNRFDARNVRSWSGTLYFMARALEQHVGNVAYLGPDKSRATRMVVNTTDRINRVSRRLSGKRLVSDMNRILAMRLAQYFEQRIRETNCDILYAPVASTEIAHLKTNLPIIYMSDLTWAGIVNYYPDFVNLSARERKEGERIEAAAIGKAAALIYPSEWAAQSAISHYNADSEWVYTIPFGANLEQAPSRTDALSRKLTRPLKLLWVGVDWQRKGGPIALECLARLNEIGIDAELTVVGCAPPAEFAHPRLKVIPFLSKSIPEQRNRLSQLFLDAHFLLFPTRAEATAIVLSESSACGLPCVISDTGGVRGAIRNGVNGFLMPLAATGIDYAGKIASIVESPETYRALVASSRDEYERCLNWDAWGRSMREVVTRVLASRRLAGASLHEAHVSWVPSTGFADPRKHET
jgi:glycosyltransferase involved in cell wall biosynthesis